jgi:cytochrome c-type biogenesis protein CcmH
MRLLVLILLILLFAPVALNAGTTHLERTQALQSRLVAPCCWQETLDRHNSPLAFELRQEVSQMVAAGRTDREILDTFRSRYGARVLVEPEGGSWWLMNIIPAVVLFTGLLILLRILVAWRERTRLAEEAAPQP